MSYEARLKGLRDAWKKDKPAEGFVSLPGGKYQFQMKRAYLEESKASFNKGNLQVHYEFVVVTGEYKGKKGDRRVDIQQQAKDQFPSGISIFKGDLKNLGLDLPADLSEKSITAVLKQTIDCVFNGTVKINKNGYPTVYINDLVNASDESEDDEDEVDEDEDDESEDESDEDESEDDEDETEDDEEEPAGEKAGRKALIKANAKKPEPKAKAKADAKNDFDDDWDDE